MKKSFFIVFLGVQAAIIILFGIFVRFEEKYKLNDPKNEQIKVRSFQDFTRVYPLLQDIHVMLFVGFAFLLSYLKRYCWSTVGMNFLVAATSIQCYILFNGFWERVFTGQWDHLIDIQLKTLINADFAACAVLITKGSILGKVNSYQILIIGIFQTFFYAFNQYIVVHILGTLDAGGSTYIHIFGGYYGLAVGYFLRPTKRNGEELTDHAHMTSSRLSKLMAITGAIFLWMYWPSFNSVATLYTNGHDRAIICTVLSLTASCLMCSATSYYLRNGQFHSDDFINGSLAGGVIVGVNAEIMADTFSPILIGAIAGIVATIGYVKVDPWLRHQIGLFDTAGVHSLHAFPAVLGTAFSACFVRGLTEQRLGVDPREFFPFRRLPEEQASVQIAALFVSLFIGLFSGLIVGSFLTEMTAYTGRIVNWQLFTDIAQWQHVDEEEEESEQLVQEQVTQTGEGLTLQVLFPRGRPQQSDSLPQNPASQQPVQAEDINLQEKQHNEGH